MVNKDLKRRIVEIAYKNKLSHLGSYFSCVDTIDWIFERYIGKAPEDIFILSNGHAALALYVVLEKYYGHNAEELFKKHGGHPHWDEDNHIYCSTGSLGTGLAIAVGRALVRDGTVHVMVSDGECAEGVVWEALKYLDTNNVPNIHIYVMSNGYGAYDKVDQARLNTQVMAFNSKCQISFVLCTSEEFPFLHGLNAHYHIMKELDYNVAMDMTK